MAEPEGARPMVDRRRLILQQVLSQGRASVGELSRELGVSEVSIRRDLEQLERVGLIRRVHGGAQALPHSGGWSAFDARLLQNVEAKQAIGQAAAGLVWPGAAVFLDSGTTVLEIARHLPQDLLDTGGLTILTRSLMVAGEVREHRQTRLIVLGGVYVHDFDDFVGTQVEQSLQQIHADILFIGTDGVSPERGLTTDNVLEAGLYRVMASCAERVVIVTDSSKIGTNKVQATLGFHEIDTFITDSAAPAEFVDMLRERGCEVILVPLPS